MLRALDRAVRHSVPEPTALIVNFPSNPTAELAELDFYREIVAFARRHEIWVLSDLAYAEIYFGDHAPPSILQVPGAKEIAVEFTSVSKTYSMPGWRMGFAAGNPRLIAALGRMKSYLDYGAFTPIQVAATAALNGPQDCVAAMRALYRERRDVLVKGLASAGWDVPCPEGSMVVWAPVPAAYAGLGSLEFSKLLLERAKVAVAPGIGFGEHGDGHVRTRWWRTRSGCARRCGIFGRFCRRGRTGRRRWTWFRRKQSSRSLYSGIPARRRPLHMMSAKPGDLKTLFMPISMCWRARVTVRSGLPASNCCTVWRPSSMRPSRPSEATL